MHFLQKIDYIAVLYGIHLFVSCGWLCARGFIFLTNVIRNLWLSRHFRQLRGNSSYNGISRSRKFHFAHKLIMQPKARALVARGRAEDELRTNNTQDHTFDRRFNLLSICKAMPRIMNEIESRSDNSIVQQQQQQQRALHTTYLLWPTASLIAFDFPIRCRRATRLLSVHWHTFPD